jgi:hypothetical protein
MDDLVSKYFQEDLTEAEDQALEEKLLDSPEDSLAFVAAGEEAYHRYGLPEPRWPGNPEDFPRLRSKGKIRPWFILVSILMAGAALWFYQTKVRPGILSTTSTGFFPLPWFSGHSKITQTAGPQNLTSDVGRPKIKMIPNTLRISYLSTPINPTGGEGVAGASRGNPRGKVTFSNGTPSTTPLDMGTSPSRAHSDLEVVIHWPKTGQVTVRVVSQDGTKEVLLYQGILQRGKWAFDWDGRLADGQTAPQGSYQILVEAGPMTQSKDIVIR